MSPRRPGGNGGAAATPTVIRIADPGGVITEALTWAFPVYPSVERLVRDGIGQVLAAGIIEKGRSHPDEAASHLAVLEALLPPYKWELVPPEPLQIAIGDKMFYPDYELWATAPNGKRFRFQPWVVAAVVVDNWHSNARGEERS